MERTIQEAKGTLTDSQKRVNQHQQTVTALEATVNEIKIKCGRLGKVSTQHQEVTEHLSACL
jgi:hypothetical protein